MSHADGIAVAISTLGDQIAGLQQVVAQLQAENEELRSQIPQPPPESTPAAET